MLAAAIILPFRPTFAAILAIGVVPLIAYPYWREQRPFPSLWAGVLRTVILAVLADIALLVTAAIAFPRQLGGRMSRLAGADGWTTPSTPPHSR